MKNRRHRGGGRRNTELWKHKHHWDVTSSWVQLGGDKACKWIWRNDKLLISEEQLEFLSIRDAQYIFGLEWSPDNICTVLSDHEMAANHFASIGRKVGVVDRYLPSMSLSSIWPLRIWMNKQYSVHMSSDSRFTNQRISKAKVRVS